jgi:hypothetical protein
VCVCVCVCVCLRSEGFRAQSCFAVETGFSVFGPIKSSEWENKQLKNSTRDLIVNVLFEF